MNQGVSKTAARHLETVYQRIAEQRMRDLPLYNERLRVEAVGFRPWGGHVIGVLVTPWCMNLLLIPGAEDDRSALDWETVSKWQLPGATIEFNPCLIDDAMPHLSASLFSTVQDFPDQTTARAIGLEVIHEVLDPAGRLDQEAAPGGNAHGHRKDDLLGGPVSRRGLLRRVALLDP